MFLIIKDADDRMKVKNLYLQHKDKLFGVAFSILHDKSLAEEAVHDTFVRIIERENPRFCVNLIFGLHKPFIKLYQNPYPCKG